MIKCRSFFRDPKVGKSKFLTWQRFIEAANNRKYHSREILTSLGKTQVYSINEEKDALDTLVIFPGFRTSALIWDLDNGLSELSNQLRIFLIETNGQPNLSEGNSPSIKSLDYGIWGQEVFDALNLTSAFIAGASFGGLVCMKIALVMPTRIRAAFLLNPACFRLISFGVKNLFYNVLPLIHTTNKNVRRFLKNIIFCEPEHQLSESAEDLLITYQKLAIASYKSNTEKPYAMSDELNDILVDTYLLVGAKDLLIPYKKSVSNAQKHLGEKLKNVMVYKNVGHGIECYPPAISFIEKTIKKLVLRN